ncbi:MAG: hypothetical protein ACTSQP_21520 [Promethearchaeota archaeon]
MGIIKDINNILKYGQKTTTYKYATLLAIIDYIIEHPSEASINNLHFIPIVYLARQFVFYYYPLSFYDFYQGSLASGKKLKIFKYINDLKLSIEKESGNYRDKAFLSKITSLKENGIFWISTLCILPDNLPNYLIKLLWKVRNLILYQPLRFLHNVKSNTIKLFGILCDEINYKYDYDVHRKAGIKHTVPDPLNWVELLQYDNTSIIINDITYKDLEMYRFWARNVILNSWVDYSSDNKKLKGGDCDTDFLYKIIYYVYNFKNQLNFKITSYYRKLYEKINAMSCIYTGSSFESNKDFHIDCFLPWFYYPINRFWNLFPSKKEITLNKKNNLVEWNKNIEANIQMHIRKCIQNKDNPIIENDLKYFYYILQKRQDIRISEYENTLIEKELFEFIKSEYMNLLKMNPGKIFKIN